ncbi:MAG: potassium channel family protein [Solirubrobacterales bacterium]
MGDSSGRTGQLGDRIRERADRDTIKPRFAAGLIASIWLIAVIIFGIVEHLVDEKSFPTIWLGMWWALQTVTTVGYGDVVPASSAGRIIASLVLLGGLALLSVVTATITSAFVARAQKSTRTDADDELLAEVRELRAEVRSLSERLERS